MADIDPFEAQRAAPRLRDQAERAALVAHGVTSLDALLAVVRDRTAPTPVRVTACRVTASLKQKRAVGALLTAFGDPDVELARVAAHSLGVLGSRRAVRPLIAALEDDNPERREAAAYALGNLDDKRAVEPLLRTLADPGQDVRVRAQAAESLGYLMDERAVEPLIATLRDPAPEVRFWSAFAHGWLRDRRALPALRRLAAEDAAEVPGWWSVGKEAADTIPYLEQGWSDGSDG